MTKKSRIILATLVLLIVIGLIISLFMPYLVKSNIRSGDLSLPTVLLGYHYNFKVLTLFFLSASIFSILKFQKQYFTVILSFLVLICIYLTRFSIHFQGFIDHDFDTQTGAGFRLLFALGIAHFVVCGVAFVMWIRNRTNLQETT